MTAAATRRGARPNGWYGMVILVATEASLFGTSLVRFHSGVPAPTRSLTYLPLR